MLNLIRIYRLYVATVVVCVISATALAAPPANLPKRIQANYTVVKDGMPFAKITEQYIVTGDTYQIESTAKGIGVYALLGVRKLTSTGKVTEQGLQPTHFELHQGNNLNKALFADFDWANNTLRMLVKGEPQTVPLPADTQDLASFAYQFMFMPRPFKNNVAVTLTTGKKLNQYQYQVKPEPAQVNVAGVPFKTIHLVPAEQKEGQIETKELWLAIDKNFVLTRFVTKDEDGTTLEQTLTELHVD